MKLKKEFVIKALRFACATGMMFVFGIVLGSLWLYVQFRSVSDNHPLGRYNLQSALKIINLPADHTSVQDVLWSASYPFGQSRYYLRFRFQNEADQQIFINEILSEFGSDVTTKDGYFPYFGPPDFSDSGFESLGSADAGEMIHIAGRGDDRAWLVIYPSTLEIVAYIADA